MNSTENNYIKQAQDFLDKTGATITVNYARTGKYFPDDTNERDIYSVSINRGSRGYTFEFGQSYNDSGRFWKYGNYQRGISHGIGEAHKKPFTYAGANDWEENKNFSAPSVYDILAAVQKYDPGTFENFCSEFGYDTDSRTAEKTYQAVKNEYQNIAMLFSDTELNEMQEIN